jgi:hypothetical protein
MDISHMLFELSCQYNEEILSIIKFQNEREQHYKTIQSYIRKF